MQSIEYEVVCVFLFYNYSHQCAYYVQVVLMKIICLHSQLLVRHWLTRWHCSECLLLQVLSLDSNITEKVANLKLDLLRILNVGQFSSEAEFINPSTSYTVPEVNTQQSFTNHNLSADSACSNWLMQGIFISFSHSQSVLFTYP